MSVSRQSYSLTATIAPGLATRWNSARVLATLRQSNIARHWRTTQSQTRRRQREAPKRCRPGPIRRALSAPRGSAPRSERRSPARDRAPNRAARANQFAQGGEKAAIAAARVETVHPALTPTSFSAASYSARAASKWASSHWPSLSHDPSKSASSPPFSLLSPEPHWAKPIMRLERPPTASRRPSCSALSVVRPLGSPIRSRRRALPLRSARARGGPRPNLRQIQRVRRTSDLGLRVRGSWRRGRLRRRGLPERLRRTARLSPQLTMNGSQRNERRSLPVPKPSRSLRVLRQSYTLAVLTNNNLLVLTRHRRLFARAAPRFWRAHFRLRAILRPQARSERLSPLRRTSSASRPEIDAIHR